MDFINILTFVLTAYHIKCQSVGIIMLYLLVQHVVVSPAVSIKGDHTTNM